MMKKKEKKKKQSSTTGHLDGGGRVSVYKQLPAIDTVALESSLESRQPNTSWYAAGTFERPGEEQPAAGSKSRLVYASS